MSLVGTEVNRALVYFWSLTGLLGEGREWHEIFVKCLNLLLSWLICQDFGKCDEDVWALCYSPSVLLLPRRLQYPLSMTEVSFGEMGVR